MIPIYKPYITENTLKFAHESLDSGWISSHGKYKEIVEEILKKHFDCKYALLVFNGTCATHLVAKALKYKYPNINRIIAPSNSYVAAINSFLYDSYDWKIELLDSNLETWNAEYQNVQGDENTAFLIVPNLGNMINVENLKKKNPKSIFVEDNCEGFFGLYNNKRAGSASLCISLSFFGNKDLTSGEGGAFLTSDEEVYKYIKKIHAQGQSDKRYIHDEFGYNYRMTNIQAAILYGQLLDSEKIRNRKKEIFSLYKSELSKSDRIKFQKTEENTQHSNWMLGVRIIKQDNSYEKALSFFNEYGIEIRPMFYPASFHKYLNNFQQIIFGNEENSKILNESCLLFPCYPEITDEEIKYICSKILEYL